MRTIDMDSLVLKPGSHDDWEDGACLLEACAYMAGEEWTDRPACVCPVLGQFGRTWNDDVVDSFRQRLKPFIPRILNTANDGYAEARAWLCTDWLIRVLAPACLRLISKHDQANALEGAPAVLNPEAAIAVRGILNVACAEADAAWAAAGSAARYAARAAVGSAARYSAWAAAGAAAGSAARRAAWAAAGDAAGDAAWDAARDAARAAVWDAGAAARDVLRPTVEQLQESALQLFDAMCALGEDERRAALQ